MCGIAGVISWDRRTPVSEPQLRAMAAKIAHRGPDGEAVFLNRPNPGGAGRTQVGLAFRRLAVLDCDARAMQPMRSADGRYAIVFNGEIYNFRELKKRLPGREWRTSGDTEVLLAALAEWGRDITLPRLDGMFAIAVWDEREQTLLLARDRMGQKPLYYAAGDGAIAFASELGALREWPHVDRSVDDFALDHYLRYGYVRAPQSIFRGVRQLPPGGWLTATPNTPAVPYEQGRWYDLDRTWAVRPQPPSTSLAPVTPEQTRASIEKAVARQLVSDVPLGVFLSGGVDSSVIASVARRHGEVRTFSVGFDDPRYDETEYAEAVARHLGTRHRTFRVGDDVIARVADDLPKLAAVFGEPFADSSALPTHWLSQQTRTQVTVALSGDGGDELFGGYDRYRAVSLPLARLRPLATPLAALGRRLEGGHPKARLTRAGRLLASAGLPAAARYDRYVSLFDAPAASALLGRPVGDVAAPFPLATRPGPTEAALAYDRATYLPGDLLTKVDRCSMLHALEVRSPFMDPDLLMLADGLRRSQLLGGGPKRLLREAYAAALPAFVFKRGKTGFAVPVGEWLRTSLRPLLHDTLSARDGFCRSRFDVGVVDRLVAEHDAGREHGQRLYALLMLELWWLGNRQ